VYGAYVATPASDAIGANTYLGSTSLDQSSVEWGLLAAGCCVALTDFKVERGAPRRYAAEALTTVVGAPRVAPPASALPGPETTPPPVLRASFLPAPPVREGQPRSNSPPAHCFSRVWLFHKAVSEDAQRAREVHARAAVRDDLATDLSIS
jgi:hypothetical protein